MTPPLIVFRVNLALPLMNVWQRWHFHQKHNFTKELSWHVAAALNHAGVRVIRPIQKCEVEIVRHSSGEPDWESLAGSAKPMLDVLQPIGAANKNGRRKFPYGLGIIADDGQHCIIRPLRMLPAVCPRGQAFTVVRIWNLEGEPVGNRRDAASCVPAPVAPF